MQTLPLMKNPSIRNSSDYQDRNGLLGKALLEANVIKEVYKVSDKSKFVIANINIVNPTLVTVEVKLWVSFDNDPTLIDIVESKIVLEPDAVYVRSVLILDKLERVFAMSDTTDVVIRIDGYDDRPI